MNSVALTGARHLKPRLSRFVAHGALPHSGMPKPRSSAPRYFSHALDDTTDVPDSILETALIAAAARVAQGRDAAGMQGPNLYVGSAGVALACWMAATTLQQQALSGAQPQGRHVALAPLAPSLMQQAVELIQDALATVAATRASSHASSLLDGTAGVHLAGAFIFSNLGHHAPAATEQASQCLRSYTATLPHSLTCTSDEVLYGRAGYLIGAQLLHQHLLQGHAPTDLLPPQTQPLTQAIQQVSAAILQSGRTLAGRMRWHEPAPAPAAAALACRSPLFYLWHHTPYLGAAHGLVGILQALLQCLSALQQQDPQATADIKSSLSYVLAHERDVPDRLGLGGHYPSVMHVGWGSSDDEGEGASRPPLVHWCHGAPGVVMLMVKAHEVLAEHPTAPGASTSQYLEAAVRAGELVWQRGLLRKGPGLCHGICGNAYALLSLFRATGDSRWLRRARHFAAFLNTPEAQADFSTPDSPASLYGGLAAALPLLATLLSGRPQAARMPAYEAP